MWFARKSSSAIPGGEEAPLLSSRGMARLQQCCTCLASAKVGHGGLAFANSPGFAVGDASIPVRAAASG